MQQLNKELNEKVVEIQRLEEELAKKDELIVQQEISIRGLQADVEELTQNVANKETKLNQIRIFWVWSINPEILTDYRI